MTQVAERAAAMAAVAILRAMVVADMAWVSLTLVLVAGRVAGDVRVFAMGVPS
ncbi:hypothetical protein FHS99_000562 [Sphingomonas prati]|uniref:Uncharacterized protein n=1 Tax=Sphingomonas prati TaxID=1843237 RepID=A0A7W9BQ34_9SPHN|nr:hypothetical protein [Sphingomonas prati]